MGKRITAESLKESFHQKWILEEYKKANGEDSMRFSYYGSDDLELDRNLAVEYINLLRKHYNC